MDDLNPKNQPKGASQDTPQTELKVNAPQQPQRPRGKRISGAEQKRRRKARLAQLSQTGPTSSSNAAISRDPTTIESQAPSATSDQVGKRVDKSMKRQRSDTSTPTPPPKKKGRPQPQPTAGSSKAAHTHNRSYKEAAERQLRVAVIDTNNPVGKLSANQAEMVKNELAKIIDQLFYATESTTPAPTFKGWRYSGEILRISCENNYSLEWFKKVVSDLPPLWEAAHLKVVQEDCLQRLRKAAIWIPEEPEDLEVVKRRLEWQNPWANVGSWCVFHTAVNDQPPGRLIVFGIGEADQANLNARGGKLNYRFSSLKVKVRNPAKPVGASTSAQPQKEPQQLPQEQLSEEKEASPPRLPRQPMVSECSNLSSSPGPITNWDEFANLEALLESESSNAE
ncbi:hypothetical protein RI129_001484 [Pyrocoelia pectoralis]|uniref:DUF4780 domain-containing protein n=1 Tax=Pyrocoelia pectoralis TaxID=417401 RepID=A0AAN7VJN8_9COLE